MTSSVSDSLAATPSAIATRTATITAAIDRLRSLTQIDQQLHWRMALGDLPVEVATQSQTWANWAIALLNDRQHIAWDKGKQVLWLGLRLEVPEFSHSHSHDHGHNHDHDHSHGYPLEGLTLRLALTWWAEDAQIFVNGARVQAGDLFDCSTRIVLTPAARPGEAFEVALRLVSPGHDNGALVRSRCIYERSPESEGCPEPGFVADELAVVQQYVTTFDPSQLEGIEAAIAAIAWDTLPNRAAFDESLNRLRDRLLPLGDWVKQRRIGLLGHAHLDLAWLWPVAETWDAAERTFESVLGLQRDFPELIFCHSTPALYAWVEEHRPELFAAICDQIAAGRWEVVAGLWIEPELNLINGESLVRQVLYGQRYVQQRFGAVNKIAWLPDSFGFCWQLPQILTQGGVEYFVTQKLRWNDTNSFPYEVFWWQSPDGSQILSLNSAPIGEGIDPVKMATYSATWEQATQISQSLWLPGVGDHGGGPSRDMLETARRWQRSPFFPQLDFTTAERYLDGLAKQESAPGTHGAPSASTPAAPYPVWNDELYLEFHRGCYTTHADQKQQNRHCERLLYQAELFSSLATLTTGADYPAEAIATAWKTVLFNQFHDILPGSSIPEVFEDANRDWAKAQQLGEQVLTEALGAIAQPISLPPPPHPDAQPIVVFNALTWARSAVVVVPLPKSDRPSGHAPGHASAQDPDQGWQVLDLDGNPVPTQWRQNDGDQAELLMQAIAIPGVGYRTYWLTPKARPEEILATADPQRSSLEPAPDSAPETLEFISPEAYVLENDQLRVTIDPTTGDISQLFDKVQQRNVLSAPGNQLQAFADSGQYWDAWNIDPDYANKPLPPPVLKSIVWRDRGPLQYCIRVVRQLGQSTFYQDYRLTAGSSVLAIATTVDWQEDYVMVKAAFPLAIAADYATYEIPCGAIQRPTQSAQNSDPRDRAKWEVPALQWADLSETSLETAVTEKSAEKSAEKPAATISGVSLLNDCKHGYDAQPSQLRLTLLRSSHWPHANADKGMHQFTYALYPHVGSWQAAQTARHAYELNQPLVVRLVAQRGTQAGTQAEAREGAQSADSGIVPRLPAEAQLLRSPASNLFPMALKRSEDDPQRWMWRFYEGHGEAVEVAIADFAIAGLDSAAAQPTSLLEGSSPASIEGRSLSIAPWKITTLALTALSAKP